MARGDDELGLDVDEGHVDMKGMSFLERQAQSSTNKRGGLRLLSPLVYHTNAKLTSF